MPCTPDLPNASSGERETRSVGDGPTTHECVELLKASSYIWRGWTRTAKILQARCSEYSNLLCMRRTIRGDTKKPEADILDHPKPTPVGERAMPLMPRTNPSKRLPFAKWYLESVGVMRHQLVYRPVRCQSGTLGKGCSVTYSMCVRTSTTEWLRLPL
ncbi:hypothetical protein DAEQUDRAFT_196084 [Daedalea quercina L-15889]|uniref:Uncharacterized protein n=1 Tax=Daedalea quercina L-15889 TaxID=1314783 RepID=A0A165U7J3_9APHY|nr:hypothetical protein DAEQUDRAFT_196084 [Daedalea quercina L-15889]